MSCRFPEDVPVLGCAEGEVKGLDRDENGDAALPFLSGSAGLMIVASLFLLQAGEWDDGVDRVERLDGGAEQAPGA
jgi:hypothetical protein